MASIEARHAYRFQYLRSDHWANLRLQKLVEQDAQCSICKCRDLSNDIHHIAYRPNLKDAKLSDLAVLCRRCHQEVHAVMVKYKIRVDLEKINARWRTIKKKVRFERDAPQRKAKAIRLRTKQVAWIRSLCVEMEFPAAFIPDESCLNLICERLVNKNASVWRKGLARMLEIARAQEFALTASQTLSAFRSIGCKLLSGKKCLQAEE